MSSSFDIYSLLSKEEYNPLLILKKKKLNKEIVSKHLELKKKFKLIEASKIIQRWFRKILFRKSNSRHYSNNKFLENENDSDLITHENVSKIPKIYLYIYQIPKGQYRGGHLVALLDWISRTPYYYRPNNPYLCSDISEDEINKLFNITMSRIELYQSNQFLSKKYSNQIIILTNSLERAYQSNLDRLEPIRVFNRSFPEIKKLIEQVKDVFCILIQNQKNLEHHLEWIQRKNKKLGIGNGNGNGIGDGIGNYRININDWLLYCRDEFQYSDNLLEFIPMIDSIWKYAQELDVYSNLYIDGEEKLIGWDILNQEFKL